MGAQRAEKSPGPKVQRVAHIGHDEYERGMAVMYLAAFVEYASGTFAR